MVDNKTDFSVFAKKRISPRFKASFPKRKPRFHHTCSNMSLKFTGGREEEVLYMACICGDEATANALLDAGVNPSATDSKFNASALSVAIMTDLNDVALRLIRMGADVNTADTDCGFTPLMRALHNQAEEKKKKKKKQKGCDEVVEALLAAGADVNAKSKHGLTALYLATDTKNHPIVLKLLSMGADPNVMAEPHGMSPLHLSIFHEEVASSLALLKAGANPNLVQGSIGLTSFMVAIRLKNEELAFACLEHGASVEEIGGIDPLLLAVEDGLPNVVKKIMEKKNAEAEAAVGAGGGKGEGGGGGRKKGGGRR